jgi:hypothetical protein
MAAGTDTPRPNGSGANASTASSEARPVGGSGQKLARQAPTQSDAIAALTYRLTRLTQEVSEARLRNEQLKPALEHGARRIQQLIGEREQLISLLSQRDAELQRLSRELGALTERAAPAVHSSSPSLVAATRALLQSIRPARKVAVRARSTIASEVKQQASAEPPLVPWLTDGAPKSVLGVVVFGLSAAEIEGVLGIVQRHCAERDLAPLLLTDNDAFQLFRGRRVLIEFLPARADQERFAADLDWRLFTLRRLALIRRKWQPVRVIAFGRPAAEVVHLWLDSPFEPTPIPASLKGRAAGAEPDWSVPQLAAIGA